MNIVDGRGLHKLDDQAKNREIIRNFFMDNPGSTISDCCRETGFVYRTVKNHINALKGKK